MENKYLYDLSIVIPIFNEEESIPFLYEKLKKSLEKLKMSYEILLIDDGSKDASYEKLCFLAAKDPTFKIIKFRRNFGQTAAMSAGIDQSNGRVIITLDADLQNDPEDIPLLLNKLDEGYDIVSGWRKNRKDRAITRKIPSMIANKLISKITGVYLNDYGCTLKAYKSHIIKKINLYGELHRFIPAVAHTVGAKVTEIPVSHYSRAYGNSKYGISRTFRVILDLVTVKFLLSYMAKPMHFFGSTGLFVIFLSFLSGTATIYMKLFMNHSLTRNPFFTITIFTFLMGMQLILTGLMSEMLMRTYFEGQEKTPYELEKVYTKKERRVI